MRKLAVCALLAVAACGRGIDPNDPTAMVPPLALEPPPIYALLGYRSDLELTSEQVSALDSIAQAVDDSTRAAVAELRRASSENSRYRGMVPITDESRPLLNQVREHHRRAALAVQEVLDEEQEAEVCRLYEPDRAERERMRGREGIRRAQGDDRIRARLGADSLLMTPRSFWSWCPSER